MPILQNLLFSFLLSSPILLAEVISIETPTLVVEDADGNTASPWSSNGQTELRLEFDTSNLIPAGATINSVVINASGQSILPSFRSEIQITLTAPSGGTSTWDAGADLGFPGSSGSWATGDLSNENLTGTASGLFSVIFAESLDDVFEDGIDARINTIALTIDYSNEQAAIGAYLDGILPSNDPSLGGPQPPATLSATGAFTDLEQLTTLPGLLPYTVNSPLWSDNANKLRWIAIPSDGQRDSLAEQIVFSPDSPWDFPEGTVAIKHFELPIDESNPAAIRRLETRFLVALSGGDFYGITYRWREDGSDADLLPGGASDLITLTNTDGTTRTQTWDYPSRLDCRACHNQGAGVFLGVNTPQLNGDLIYPNESTPTNQLERWNSSNLFTTVLSNSASYPAAVSLDDASASLDDRINSYLASNCGNCHNPSSDLNTTFDLQFSTSLSDSGLIDGIPIFDLGVNGASLIAPQEPTQSVLYLRTNTDGINRMPPLGRNTIHQQAVTTLEQWILSLSPSNQTEDNPPLANDDETFTTEGNAITIAALANDVDIDGHSFSRYQSTNPSHGTAIWDSNGQVTYTPFAGHVGLDEFSYQIINSTNAISESATIRVTTLANTSSNEVAFVDNSAQLAAPSSFSGVAMGVADMNFDGRDDIVRLLNGRNLFIDYQNNDGTFSELSLGTPSSNIAWGMAIGDTNNDGYPEIITGGFNDGLHYQRTNSSGAFTDTNLTGPTIFLQAVNFADIDNDGWLDLFPCHDLGANTPYLNDGAGNLSHDASLIDTRTIPTSDNSGNYGSIWTDYDGDGDIDLYISKCRSFVTSFSDLRRINQLFRNNGDGTFTDVAASAGLADGSLSWSADFADIDNDGDLDCFIGNHRSRSHFYLNNGDGTFTENTAVSDIDVTWDVIQTIFRDFNNDGWIDLFLTGEEHGIWVNDQDGTFTKISNPLSTNFVESAALGDLNHDGFTDIYAGYANLYNGPNFRKPDKLFSNTPNGNGFLSVRLLGRQSNRLASGALLELHGPWGVQIREVRSGEGYGITNSSTQIFGMGNQPVADRLVVRWPSGTVDTVFNVSTNQFLTLEEGDTSSPSLTNPGNLSHLASSPVDFQIMASDPHNNALTFSATNLPTGLSLNPNTGRITGTTSSSNGIFVSTLSVHDGWSTTFTSFIWSVTGGTPNTSGSGGNPSNSPLPFEDLIPTIPTRIQAENFDEGISGIAAFDLDPENIGQSYRDTSVDILPSNDLGGGHALGWIENSEWTQYTITANPGLYDLTARISSAETTPGLIRILINDRELGFLTVQGTAEWDNWEDSSLSNIAITEGGLATLRLEYIGGPYHLNWLEFTPSNGGEDPLLEQQAFYRTTPLLPGRIQAENYDFGGPNVAYSDQEPENLTNSYRNDGVDVEPSRDIDGSFSVGWFQANEWLEYTVSPEAGLYRIDLRVAAGEPDPGGLRILLAGTELASLTTPNTGGSMNWETISIDNISIPTEGEQILRVETIGGGTNLNWIDFIRTDSPANGNSPLNSQELLAAAFGPWDGRGLAKAPQIAPPINNTIPVTSFLIRLGGWRTESGYSTNELNYEPSSSTDLIEWHSALETTSNPSGLPVPSAGFKYVSYLFHESDRAKAFFKVQVEER